MSAIIGRPDPNLVKKGLFEDLQVTGALTVNRLRFFTDTTLQVIKPPIGSYDIVNKEYLDSMTASNFVTVASGKIGQKGGLIAPTGPQASEIAVWTGEPLKLKAVTGAKLTDAGDLAVTQVTAKTVHSTVTTRLTNTVLAGETSVSGSLFIQDPTADERCAVNKKYVDQFLTSGVRPKASVKAATTPKNPVHPSAEYLETDMVVVITSTSTLTIDSIEIHTGDRLLLKDEPNPAYNGVYTVSECNKNMKTGMYSFKLKRAVDAWYDSLIIKSAYYVESGAVNGKTIWVCTNFALTVGIDPIVYTQFASIGTPSFVSVGTGAGRLFSKAVGSELHLKTVGANSAKIVVTDNRDEITLDVRESEININNLAGIASVKQGGTGLSTVPKGHLVSGTGLDSLTTIKPPSGDLVGTEEPQFLTGKTFDQISFVGRSDFVTTVLPSSDFSENVTVWLPPTSDTLVGETSKQSLINKVINGDNVVTATYLKSNASKGADVEVACYAPPQPGQVLTILTPDKAIWKFPPQTQGQTQRQTEQTAPQSTTPISPYFSTFFLTFTPGKWSPITRNARGAGQIIFSSDSTDSTPQLVVSVAKSDSTKSDFMMNPLCEIGKLTIRWKAGKGIEAKCRATAVYTVTVVGMVACHSNT